MALPTVAIVGRPNVGKSAMLNWLARERISIVDPTPGVTRDRVSAIVAEDDVYFELVDTGGFGIPERDELGEHVEQQIFFAVQQADLVLFVVDVRAGVAALDRRVSELLRQHDRPVILVANKADTPADEPAAAEFFPLGFGQPIVVSVLHRMNRAGLVEAILGRLQGVGERPDEPAVKLAIVGRRNVGKSTFINALAGQQRVIVSEMPGTTRDSVDVRFERAGRTFVAIDTAGLRKRRKLADGVEFYSQVRTHNSIRRCDVVLLLIDATERIGEVDKKLAAFIQEQCKPCVLVVNKWDLAQGRATVEDYSEYLLKTLPGLDFAPIALTTATRSEKIDDTIRLAESLFRQARTRVSTGELNRAVEQALGERPPAVRRRTKRPKVYYATQVSVAPPTLVFFINDPTLIDDQYRRFLVRRFRELLPFVEVPMRLLFRSHRQQSSPPRTRRTPRR